MRRSQLAATLGHIGLAVTVIGIAGASAWNTERLTVMKPGESAALGGYTVTFKNVFERQGPNYAELAGAFELQSGNSLIGTIIASKRRYDAPPQATTQAGISPGRLAISTLCSATSSKVAPTQCGCITIPSCAGFGVAR